MEKRLLALVALCALLLAPLKALAEEFEMIELPSVYRSYGSALTPDSGTLFVIATTGVILVYDVQADQYVEVIDLRDDIVRPSAGRVIQGKLYVESFRDIAVVDVASRELLKKVSQPPYAGSSYGAVVASPAGDRAYAVAGSTTHVTVLDTATDEVVGRVEVGGDHTGIGISPDGSTLYVSSAESNELAIVDTSTLTVTAVVPFFEGGGMLSYESDVRVGPCNGWVYVGYVDASSRGRVGVLSPEGAIVSNYVADKFSTGLDITADGRYLVLGAGTVLDPASGAVLGEIPMPIVGLAHVTLSPDGLRAYVANVNDPYVKAIQGFVPPMRLEAIPSDEPQLSVKLHLPAEAGRPYQIGAALDTDPGIWLTDGRVVALHNDALLRHVVKHDPEAFVDFAGSLDERGDAEGTIYLERDFPGKAIGQKVYLLFVTLEGDISRSNVRTISNLVSFTVME